MNLNFLEFEQPIAELRAKIEELRLVGSDNEINIQEEIERLEGKSRSLTESIFSNLSPWQISQLARHPLRPYTLDYVAKLFTEFEELHGDRAFADDAAIVGGIARLEGRPVMVIGHQKGKRIGKGTPGQPVSKQELHEDVGGHHDDGHGDYARNMSSGHCDSRFAKVAGT